MEYVKAGLVAEHLLGRVAVLIDIYGCNHKIFKEYMVAAIKFSQLRVGHDVSFPTRGDFLIDGRYLFEVGGKGKTFEQIADIADSFLAVDETDVGHGNRIPLWLFGFLY